LNLPEGSPRYLLRIARPAARSIAEQLPESVAAAVLELLTGNLLLHPRRVGKPLQRELASRWVARRGSYRVIFTIDDETRTVTVLAIDHGRDIYKRR